MNPMDLKRGVDAAVEAVIEERKKAKGLLRRRGLQVGTISANGDTDVGAMISDAMQKVGKEGVITVEEAVARDRA